MQEWEEGKEFGMEAGRRCMGTPDRREEQENRERSEETEEGQWAWPDMESAGFHSFSSAAALFFIVYILKRPIIIEHTWQQPIIMGQFH